MTKKNKTYIQSKDQVRPVKQIKNLFKQAFNNQFNLKKIFLIMMLIVQQMNIMKKIKKQNKQ